MPVLALRRPHYLVEPAQSLMASPGFSPISEDGDAGEPQNATPPLPPGPTSGVTTAGTPTFSLSGETVASQLREGTVLLLPATVSESAAFSGAQPTISTEFESEDRNRRISDGSSMELDGQTATGAPTHTAGGATSLELLSMVHRGSADTQGAASASHPQPSHLQPSVAAVGGHQLSVTAVGRHHPHVAADAATPLSPAKGGSWKQQQPTSGVAPSAGLAAAFSAERISAVLASATPGQASVETVANFIYQFAAVIPPPHIAAAATQAASQAARAASQEAAAAAAAAAAPGVPTPAALRALSRAAGAKAAAAAAAGAGALPLAICYLMLDAYRSSHQATHRLAVFYVFHRLAQLGFVARGNTEAQTVPGSIETAGLNMFVIPVLQELSDPAMDAVRHKMLRCVTVWRDWGVYPPATLRQLRQLASKGVSTQRPLDRGECAASEAWAALLQLSSLRFLVQTPSGRKAYAYACHCFKRICRESLTTGVEILKAAAEAAADSVAGAASVPGEEGTAGTSNGDEENASKRQRGSSDAGRESGVTAESQDTAGLLNGEFSISNLRLLSNEQLLMCSQLFDRASRVTGQEYLLLQSALMDLSGLLQMQHHRLCELREEMHQFAGAEGGDGASTLSGSSEQLQKVDTPV